MTALAVLLVDDPEPRHSARRVGRDVLDLEESGVGVAAAAVPEDVDPRMPGLAERRPLRVGVDAAGDEDVAGSGGELHVEVVAARPAVE